MKSAAALLSLCLLGSVPSAARADGIIQTLVGVIVQNGVPAQGASVGSPTGLVADPVGNVYFSDAFGQCIRRIDGATSILSTVAGTGQAGFSGDLGPASSAQLNQPQGLAYVNTGAGGNEFLFVADTGNQRIRQIDLKTGIISTVAGNGTTYSSPASNGDSGPAVLASLFNPTLVAADTSGHVWFLDGNGMIRAFTVGTGTINTVAGTGGAYSGGGTAKTSGLGSVTSLLAPSDGNLYIGSNGHILVMSPSTGANITAVAGTGTNNNTGDGGPALAAQVNQVTGLAADASSNLYFTDSYLVRRINAASRSITTVAGNTGTGSYYLGDGGPAYNASFAGPRALGLDGNGDLYLIDSLAIRKIDAASQIISNYGGIPVILSGSASVQATKFALSFPMGPVPAPTPGDLFVADSGKNGQVFLYHGGTGQLTLYAGSGFAGYSGDGGPATAATFYGTNAMASDNLGNLYLADNDNDVNNIRRIDAVSQQITSVAATAGGDNYAGDGQPGLSPLMQMGATGGIAWRPGTLYFSVTDFNTIRKLDLASGTVSLVAGPGAVGTAGLTDGPLAGARFNQPEGVAADAAGNVYVADLGNNAVRKIDLTALTVTTVAGLGPTEPGYRGDGGPAKAAGLNAPSAVWLDGQGNLYIADSGNERVRRIDAATGIITTVAGDGLRGAGGDNGDALLAQLNGPLTGMVDAAGDLYVDDVSNARIRKVTYFKVPTPTPVSPGLGKAVAYPSPADTQVCFSYFSPVAGHVSIEVYNMAFQLAARFEADAAGPGAQLSCGDTSKLSTGAYIWRLSLPGGTSQTGKFKVIH